MRTHTHTQYAAADARHDYVFIFPQSKVAIKMPIRENAPKSTMSIIQGSLEVKLPTVWPTDRWKSRSGKSQRRERQKKDEEWRSQKRKDPGVRKGRNVMKLVKPWNTVFPKFCGFNPSRFLRILLFILALLSPRTIAFSDKSRSQRWSTNVQDVVTIIHVWYACGFWWCCTWHQCAGLTLIFWRGLLCLVFSCLLPW